VHGFGPRHKEIWMPQTSKVHRAVYDRIHVKKEAKEVAACHNPIPFTVSPLATWAHGEEFDLAPFPPNPYQTNIAPFMYCSDYCHISQGTPPSTVVDQIKHQKAAHKGCKTGYVVSRD
ncbi:Major facilitator superfamily MFS_1, partial [Operophtera brumata]